MSNVTAEQVSGIVPVDPNAAGGGKRQEQAQAEAAAVVHPRDQVPDETGGAPGPAPIPSTVEHPSEDEWKASLPPDVAKRVDQIITSLRQKDTDKFRGLETQVQRLGWATELNRLVGSEDPADRQQAQRLLKAALSTLDDTTQETAADPLADVDWESAEALVPGLGKGMQYLIQQNAELRERLGETHAIAQSSAYRETDRGLQRELQEIGAWAKARNLPFDPQVVIDKDNALGTTDLKAAYFAAYGEQLIDAGKTAAQAALAAKKAASLPGGSIVPGSSARPKFTSMQDHWENVKREAGVTGPIEYKG